MKKQTKLQKAAKKYSINEVCFYDASDDFIAGAKWLERALKRAKKKHPLWSLEALLDEVMK